MYAFPFTYNFILGFGICPPEADPPSAEDLGFLTRGLP